MPRMTMSQLRKTSVGQANQAYLDAAIQEHEEQQKNRLPALDMADAVLDQARQLALSTNTHEAQAGAIVTSLFRNYPVGPWFIDLAAPYGMVAIEINGGRWLPGGGKHGSSEDRKKLRALGIMGWLCLEYTTEEWRYNPIGILEEIACIIVWRQEDRYAINYHG